ncbi:MAG TPA: tetratricopeptide repeat protein [Bryobacteraceae bacterium]|nr:tetratricopeptide repeat protein [Bryobacteraceae bacterium]
MWARRSRLRPAIFLVAFLGLLDASAQKQPAAAPASFDRVSQEAAAARAQNRIQDAIRLYRQAVKLRSSWPEGWWFLGELLYDQDKYPEARDALLRLVSLDHTTGPGYALLGLCEYETREYGKALEHINEARRLGLGDDPQVKRVVLYHAMLLLTRFQQYESALQVLDKIMKTGESGPALIEAAGLAGLRRPILPGDIPPGEKDLIDQAGRAACAVAAQDPARAQKEFAVLLARYPNTPNVHYLYGSFLLATDENAGLREFQKELELNPKHTEALANIALSYEMHGDTGKAISYARRAVEANPQYFAAHAVLGRLLANAGEVAKGIQELEIARQEAPDSYQVHFALAEAYALADRKSDAAKERAEFVRLKQLADQTLGK